MKKDAMQGQNVAKLLIAVLLLIVMTISLIGCNGKSGSSGSDENDKPKLYEIVGSPYIHWMSLDRYTHIQVEIKNIADKPIVARFTVTDHDGIATYSNVLVIEPGKSRFLIARTNKQYGNNADLNFSYMVQYKQ